MRLDASVEDAFKRFVLLRWEQYKEVSDKLFECAELTTDFTTKNLKMEETKFMKLPAMLPPRGSFCGEELVSIYGRGHHAEREGLWMSWTSSHPDK